MESLIICGNTFSPYHFGVAEQAITVQRLNPLRVVDIGFAAGHTLGGGGVEQ